ncbi:MAG: hypothetical protein AB8C02_07180 [Halioglobus sp.]
MKKVGSCLVALVLALGSSVAVAAPGHGDRDHKGAKHHRVSKDFNVGRHHIVPRIEHASHSKHKAKQRAKQHRKHVRSHRQYKAEKQHRRQHRKHDGWRNNRWDRNRHFNKRARHNYWKHNGWRYNHWNHRVRHHRDWRHSRHYSRNRHYGNYLGAAIVGSALTYSLYHLHDGAVCYDSHEDHRDRDYERNDVVGCHRIERLEDGSQVRVDVPLSECH